MTKKWFEYKHNNSGGHDWLTKEDWSKLEKAGWTISGYLYEGTPKQKPYCAHKQFDSIIQAIGNWEDVLGRTDSEARGCNCCGRPHSFMEDAWYEDDPDAQIDLEDFIENEGPYGQGGPGSDDYFSFSS